MCEKKMSREDELKEKGWAKQNTIGELRLSELVELYESLGLEVHLEPIRLDEPDDQSISVSNEVLAESLKLAKEPIG